MKLHKDIDESLNILQRQTSGFLSKSSLTSLKELDDSQQLVVIRQFLESFMKLYQRLIKTAQRNPITRDIANVNAARIIKHTCSQLDVLSKDHFHFITVFGNSDRNNRDINRILRVIANACSLKKATHDLLLHNVISHPAIKTFLKVHGMGSMTKQWKYVILSPIIFLFYPIFYIFWKKAMKKTTVNQLLPVWSLLGLIIFFTVHIVLDIDTPEDQELSSKYKAILIIVFIWWIAFTYQEITELTVWFTQKKDQRSDGRSEDDDNTDKP